LTNLIMDLLMYGGGLTHEKIACKVVCFGVDRVSMF
jgi:hypothetical protein